MKTRSTAKSPEPEETDVSDSPEEHVNPNVRQVGDSLPLICDVACPASVKEASLDRDSVRAAYLIAQLEEEQVRQELELEQQQRLLKARNKVRLAKLKLELYDTEHNAHAKVDKVDDFKHNMIQDNNVNFHANNVESTSNHAKIGDHLHDNMIHTLPFTDITSSRNIVNRVDLPKVELQYFNGDPCEYWKFIRQFQNYIEGRIVDDGQRLLYLLYYCRGPAKASIENCCMLPPEVGYKRARQILEDLFGQSHVIAKATVDNLLRGLRPMLVDGKALTELAIKMQGCEIALTQINCEVDMNAFHTLERIVRLLPSVLQMRWARVVDKLSRELKNPCFQDLRAFIDEEARIARSRFGQIAFENDGRSSRVIASNRNEFKRHLDNRIAYNIQALTKLVCFVCKGDHMPDQCDKFREFSIQTRWTCLRNNRACFNCLCTGHRANECRNKSPCRVSGCSGKHHTLLHSEITANSPMHKTVNCTSNDNNISGVRLGVLPVCLKGPNGCVTAYALLDNGSDVTLIERDLLRKIGTVEVPTSLKIATVNGSSTIDSGTASLTLCSTKDDKETVIVDRAFCVDRVSIQHPKVSTQEFVQCWPHLNGIQLAECNDKRIKLLIGADVPEAHWALEQRIGDRKQPFAVKTLLGWIVIGPDGACRSDTSSINAIQTETADISEQLNRLYDAEFRDANPHTAAMSIEDHIALNSAKSSIILTDNHYELALPWRSNLSLNLSNYEMAIRRMSSLRRRFIRDSNFQDLYSRTIQQMLNKGYAEPVSRSRELQNCVPEWYLPHHAVLNPKKPGKFRVVFDCAARYRGVSLNDMLFQGPDITTRLVKVLMDFRIERVAISADVEEMFMQVRVPLRDRQALQFLWWDGGDISKNLGTYQMTVHPFGATSSPFCANFALKQTVEDFKEQYSGDVLNAVVNNFYVDDLLISLPSISSARTFVEQIRALLLNGGFKLRKWSSNCPEVLEGISSLELANPVIKIDDDPKFVERALGLEWDSKNDEFRFSFNYTQKEMTRRSLLSAISSLYDPLGLVSPITLPAKLLLQKLCRDRLDWDEPITKNDAEVWHNWVERMNQLNSIRIPRCIKMNDEPVSKPQLHVFCDASEFGYGAAAYYRFQRADGESYCTLAYARSRVAPLKTMSIPRLELSACQLGVRVSELVCSVTSMTIATTYYWTDSSIVLYYIRNTKSRFSTFVANRLAVIHQSSEPTQWRHVKSEDNPADLTSRGAIHCSQLKQWLRGPTFLSFDESKWPLDTINDDLPSDLELKKPSAKVNFTLSSRVHALLSHYSNWIKLLRAVAWLTRFKSYLLLLQRRDTEHSLQVGRLKVCELQQAERDVISLVQQEVYPDLYICLKRLAEGKTKGLKHSGYGSLAKLNPRLIDGLMCVGGRLEYSECSLLVKHPPILPPKHHVTNIIIRHYHELEGHCGKSQVLAAIRTRFWILQGGSAVKRVVGNCLKCRRQIVNPCKQIMAPLPTARIAIGWFPFQHVGIDYFGPFVVKRGRGTEKRYGCLFTCLQTRAVHLEVSHSMSTDSFIMALMRFIGRRGKPADIFCDNGTNLVGASKQIKEQISSLDHGRINDRLLSQGIQWHFQPPSSSHRGGVWERLIRSCRRILNILCNEQPLTDESLLTFTVEVEKILNNRPLVPLTSDDKDPEALTPNHLILMRNNSGLQLNDTLEDCYRKGFRQAEYLSRVFWRRWLREYVPLLQTRQKWLHETRNLQKGDLVIVVTDSVSKGKWPLGVILEAHTSGDKQVRSVLVKTVMGNLVRDVRKICLLEGNFG